MQAQVIPFDDNETAYVVALCELQTNLVASASVNGKLKLLDVQTSTFVQQSSLPGLVRDLSYSSPSSLLSVTSEAVSLHDFRTNLQESISIPLLGAAPFTAGAANTGMNMIATGYELKGADAFIDIW